MRSPEVTRLEVPASGSRSVPPCCFANTSFIDPEDADKVNVPVCLLPSMDEDKKAVDGVYEKLEKKNPGQNFIKWYPEHPHGWAAARGDVSTARVYPRHPAYSLEQR